MKEKDFQRMFGKYLVGRAINENAAYELKIEKSKRFAFDKVKEHQLKGLEDAWWGLYHKIADQTVGRDFKFGNSLKKPFDCLYLAGCRGYIVIWFYVPRKKKKCYIIELVQFKKIVKNSDKKSIREEELHKLYEQGFAGIDYVQFA